MTMMPVTIATNKAVALIIVEVQHPVIMVITNNSNNNNS